MCELNYMGIKIDIGVKLGTKSAILPTKNEVFTGNHSDVDTWQSYVALTCGNQRLRLTVNVQIGLPGPILQGFIKLRDQICELNYRGTKSEIGDKLKDQKCKFVFFK